MRILLTNDDGINAEGLWELYRQFSKNHSVSLVAPDRERSAVGHGITLNGPIRVTRVSVNEDCRGFAVSGTPADCIKLGILELLDSKPELVVSGINPGANVGVNINYSGTVSAAKEAALYGIPSIAVSVQARSPRHYADAGRFVAQLAEVVKQKGLPYGTLLNVNIPDLPLCEISGIGFSNQGMCLSSEVVEKQIDSDNQALYRHGLTGLSPFSRPGSDEAVLGGNYISITPIKCDATDYGLLEELRAWGIGVGGAP
jgi:5'-nucleotidase